MKTVTVILSGTGGWQHHRTEVCKACMKSVWNIVQRRGAYLVEEPLGVGPRLHDGGRVLVAVLQHQSITSGYGNAELAPTSRGNWLLRLATQLGKGHIGG
jgi:hypothetical protein